MNKISQSSGFSRVFLRFLLVMFLVVGLAVAAIYTLQTRKADERKKAVALAPDGQVEQQEERRLKIESMMVDAARIREDLKSVDKQLKAAREEADLPFYIGPREPIQAVIAESMQKIEKEKNRLVDLTLDLTRSETALENGREACMEQIWILEKGGKQARHGDPLINANHDQIAKETDILEDLELKRDKLIVYNHYPVKAKLKRIQLAIKEQNAKIAKLTAAGAGSLTVGPEEILRLYIADLKQQIGDIRLSLASDLEAYRMNYKEAVTSYDPQAKARKLKAEKDKLVVKLEFLNKQILKQQSSSPSNLSLSQ